MGARTATTSDPLLALLQRYEAELSAFNDATPIPEQGWDKIAENTWFRTQNEILERKPEATTAAGALLALDHVLKNELFADRESAKAAWKRCWESADVPIQWPQP